MKLKYGILIISGLFLFLHFSCTKFGKNVTVKGRVLNPITGEGIAGVEMKMWKNKIFSFSSDVKLVKKVTSDLNGYFEIDKLGLSGYDLKCDVSGDYYPLGWTQDGGTSFTGNFTLDVKKGKVMHADYYAVPYGNYKIIINNVNCQNTTDTIILKRTNKVESFLNIDWILTGCDGYNSSFSKVPMGTIYTHYTVIRNGVSVDYNVDFEVLPNQDNIQTINY